MRGRALARSDMTSLPVGSEHRQPAIETDRRGDAVVIRGVAALLVLVAFASLFVIAQPASFVVAASIAVGALGLFAAARWTRASA